AGWHAGFGRNPSSAFDRKTLRTILRRRSLSADVIIGTICSGGLWMRNSAVSTSPFANARACLALCKTLVSGLSKAGSPALLMRNIRIILAATLTHIMLPELRHDPGHGTRRKAATRRSRPHRSGFVLFVGLAIQLRLITDLKLG